MNSVRPPPAHPASVWDVGQYNNSVLARQTNLGAFQLQPGALDTTALLANQPALLRASPQISITTYANGKKEVSFLINSQVIATLVEEKEKKESRGGRKPASYSHRNSATVELYVLDSDASAVVAIGTKRKREGSQIGDTSTTRPPPTNSEASSSTTAKRRKLRRLPVTVTGVLMAKVDVSSWKTNASMSLSSRQLEDRKKEKKKKKKKKKSRTLGHLNMCEHPQDPLSQFPSLCSPELLLRANHVTHLARYIRQNDLCLLSPPHDVKNTSMSFAKLAALDLMHRIKNALDANTALFEKIKAAKDGGKCDHGRARTTKHSHTNHPDSSDLFELLRARRSKSLLLLLQAYNSLADACVPKDDADGRG